MRSLQPFTSLSFILALLLVLCKTPNKATAEITGMAKEVNEEFDKHKKVLRVQEKTKSKNDVSNIKDVSSSLSPQLVQNSMQTNPSKKLKNIIM